MGSIYLNVFGRIKLKSKLNDELISKLFWFREMHGYGDNDADPDAAIVSDDVH